MSAGGRSASSFDAIRLFAAFAVLVSHHFALAGRQEPIVPSFGTLGVSALTIFFVISGYFVASSWDREPDAQRFFTKRALRIFPALVIVVAVSIVIIGSAETNLSLGDYATSVATWTYWKNAAVIFGIQFDLPGVFTSSTFPVVNMSLWTLPVELIMYSIVAIAGIALQGFVRWAYPVLAMIFAVAWFVVPGDEFGSSLQLLNLGVFFLVGATVHSYGLLKHVSPAVLPVLVLVVAFAAVQGGPGTKLLLWAAFPVLVLGLGALPSRVGTSVTTMGDISYGVYLWAYPIQQIVIAHLLGFTNFWMSMMIAAGATAALGLASWRFVERPALRLKDRGTIQPRVAPPPIGAIPAVQSENR